MTLVSTTWNCLTLPGKVLAVLLPTFVILSGVAIVTLVLLGPAILDFLGANIPLVRFVLAVTIILLQSADRLRDHLHGDEDHRAHEPADRARPGRIRGGTLLSTVHGLKVLAKEDFTPTGVDPPVFTFAPVIVFLATVMSLLVIPFAPGLFGQDFNIGLLYFFAIGGLSVVGLLMAGWSSFNKYSLLGGLRAAAQVVVRDPPHALGGRGDHAERDDEPQLDRPLTIGQ